MATDFHNSVHMYSIKILQVEGIYLAMFVHVYHH